MAAIQTEIYDAFISAGADEEKARAAAQVMTGYPKPEELVTKADLKAEIAALETRLTHRLWLQSIGIIAVIIGAKIF